MEVIVRIAEEKYLKHDLASSLSDAVKIFVSDNCLKTFEKHDT